jgi:integrase/recombinase XerD
VRSRGKANTQRKHIILTKSFCEWLVNSELNTLLKIPGIKAIKPTPADKMTKTAGQMLSTVEVDKIITAGKNTRDRCLLSVLSESGMRPFECLRLKWGELKIDDFGVIINVSGKTNIPRFIRLVHSSPYVAAWRNDHPSPTDTAFIFTSLKSPAAGERITHSALKKILRLAVARAGVKKASPYLLRHSSVTRMLEEGYSDSTIRMVHWGSQTTNMLGTYGHVSATAIDAEILGMAGIKNLDKKERKPVNQCPKCSRIVKPDDQFCPTCAGALSDVAQALVDREKDQLTKDILKLVSEQFIHK